VGLGGRFDATNVVAPLACAITTIALDHQQYLGNTLESVAFEKAGIVKPNVPLIVGPVPTAARDTIEVIAKQRNAPLVSLGRDFHVEGQTPARFTYWDADSRYSEVSCPLLGAHQLGNCACAIALVKAARPRGLTVEETAIRQGLKEVQWEGRLEAVATEPLTLLDGAHNPAAAAAVAEYVRHFRGSHPLSRVVLVIAMMRDKDHAGFIEAFKGLVDDVVLTQASLKRSATVEELLPVASALWPRVRSHAQVADALAEARRLARPLDLVCVTGSLMLVGEVKALLRGCRLSLLRG
jgi:dihydrofolate synthase / folylpolyglutamate synthase